MLGLMQAPAQPCLPKGNRQVCVDVGLCVVDTCFVHQGLCPGVCVWGGVAHTHNTSSHSRSPRWCSSCKQVEWRAHQLLLTTLAEP